MFLRVYWKPHSLIAHGARFLYWVDFRITPYIIYVSYFRYIHLYSNSLSQRPRKVRIIIFIVTYFQPAYNLPSSGGLGPAAFTLATVIIGALMVLIIFCIGLMLYELFKLRKNRTGNTQQVVSYYFKVHIFWEGHKILRNLHLTFGLCSASQN